MSSATRRNGKSGLLASSNTRESTLASASQLPTSTHSKPSPYLLLIYPAILALGALYSTLSPTASPYRVAPLLPGLSSDLKTPLTPQPINYFANKRNVVNVYFVKFGWFWTTLAFLLLQLTTNPPPRAPRGEPSISTYIQAAFRYCLVTLTWIFTTQWFFGGPLVDRSFTLSGGRCQALPQEISAQGVHDIETIATSVACKAVGGKWRGGHDISGHVFMLVLSSAFLLLEQYISNRQSSHPSISPTAAANVAADLTPEEKQALGDWESKEAATARVYSRYFVWTVIGLDMFMLMMTAIWFHTWLEKLTGLLIAGTCIWGVYFLPRFSPGWKDVIQGV